MHCRYTMQNRAKVFLGSQRDSGAPRTASEFFTAVTPHCGMHAESERQPESEGRSIVGRTAGVHPRPQA